MIEDVIPDQGRMRIASAAGTAGLRSPEALCHRDHEVPCRDSLLTRSFAEIGHLSEKVRPSIIGQDMHGSAASRQPVGSLFNLVRSGPPMHYQADTSHAMMSCRWKIVTPERRLGRRRPAPPDEGPGETVSRSPDAMRGPRPVAAGGQNVDEKEVVVQR